MKNIYNLLDKPPKKATHNSDNPFIYVEVYS